MKRKLSAIVTAVMILSMGAAQVFAAGSPTEDDGYSEAAEEAVGNIQKDGIIAVDSSGERIAVKVTPVGSGSHITDEETAQVAAEEAVEAELVDLAVGENEEIVASVLGVVEVKAEDDAQFPVTLSIPVSNVSFGDAVILLHYVDGAWETIVPSLVGDGYVEAEFWSLSPVAVVLIESVERGEEDNTNGALDPGENGDDGNKQPQDDDSGKKTDDGDKGRKDGDDDQKGNGGGKGSTPTTPKNNGDSDSGNQRVSVKANNVAPSTSPVTGDHPYLFVFAAVLIAALIALGAVAAVRRRLDK